MLWINIARLTWLELWQSRTYKTLLVFALVSPVCAIILASLFMVDLGKVYMDAIAGASQVLAMVFLVFLVVTLLSRDIFERVCYVLLAPPVRRSDYFIGRFVGVLFVFLVLLLVLLASSVVGGLVYVEQQAPMYQSGYAWFHLAQLMFFNFFQYVSMLGVIFFIVSWSSGDAETMLFTVAMLIFSWVFPPVLKSMQNPDVTKETPEAVVSLLQVLYDTMPHLQGADIALALAHGVGISLLETCYYVLEHSLYGLIFFVLGLMIFQRRNL